MFQQKKQIHKIKIKANTRRKILPGTYENHNYAKIFEKKRGKDEKVMRKTKVFISEKILCRSKGKHRRQKNLLRKWKDICVEIKEM